MATAIHFFHFFFHFFLSLSFPFPPFMGTGLNGGEIHHGGGHKKIFFLIYFKKIKRKKNMEKEGESCHSYVLANSYGVGGWRDGGRKDVSSFFFFFW